MYCAFVGALVALCSVAMAGPRVLFDAAGTSAADWETGKGIGVTAGSAGVSLKVSGEPFSWAAMRSRVPAEPEAQITIGQDPSGAKAKVQAEWFSSSGEFISYSDVPESTSVGQLTRQMAKQPAQMRLKLWVEGGEKPALIRVLRIESPLRWREPGVSTVRSYDVTGKLTADKGLLLAKSAAVITATLAEGVQYSSLVFEDRVEYSPGGVVLVDTAQLAGDFSLQMLCWDKGGTYLGAIDLLRSATKAGTVEMPMSSYSDQVPAGTAKLSFKLWLGGGKAANLQLRAIHYGAKAVAK